MKKLDYYQCDFCAYTNTEEKVRAHEKGCVEDPKRKMCESCKFFDSYMSYGLYYAEVCNKGVCNDAMSDVRDGEVICKEWLGKPDDNT